jgi:hypothetical protein
MEVDNAQLLRMTRTQLDGLFRNGTSGRIPDGPAEGTALLAPGTDWNATIARVIEAVAWRGKTFDAARRIVVNRVSPFDLGDVVALVYEDASRFDGGPCLVLDYSKTSIVARFIRDEIRLIAPGLYLGKAYAGGFPACWFSLRPERAQSLAKI